MKGTLEYHVVIVDDGDDVVVKGGNTTVGRELRDGNEAVRGKEGKNIGLGRDGGDVMDGESGDGGGFEAGGVGKGDSDGCSATGGVGGEGRGDEVHGAAGIKDVEGCDGCEVRGGCIA